MRTGTKTIIIVVLGFLEIVFLSWIFASNLPRRSADLEAFSLYQKVPTVENHDLWMKERLITENDLKRRRYSGTALAIGNAFLMGWLARKRPRAGGAALG
jgi:hypothetical protein